MKISPMLAMGLLSAASVAFTLPANAAPTAPIRSTIGARSLESGPSVLQSRMLQSPTLTVGRPITMNDIRQSRDLGTATVTSVDGQNIGVRFASGNTASITITTPPGFGPGPVVIPHRPGFGPGPVVLPFAPPPRGTRLRIYESDGGALIILPETRTIPSAPIQ